MSDDYDVSMTDIEAPAPPPRHFRLQLRVHVKAVDEAGRVVADGSRLVSLSASGIGFVPSASVPDGARLELEFDLVGPNVSVAVTTSAEVVRVIDDDFELYIGCRFVGFDPRAQRALLGVLEDIRDAKSEAVA